MLGTHESIDIRGDAFIGGRPYACELYLTDLGWRARIGCTDAWDVSVKWGTIEKRRGHRVSCIIIPEIRYVGERHVGKVIEYVENPQVIMLTSHEVTKLTRLVEKSS